MSMIERYLQIETLSLVFIGDFNPVIFQPYWLANKNLIREDEARNAKIELIHNEIARIELDDWLFLEVSRNRCEFKTSKEPYFYPLKDLASGIFSILNETPIKSFGLNHIYELSLKSKEHYYNFGSALTPLNIWTDDLNDPRLFRLEIYEQERKNVKNSSRRIRITPTDQQIPFGITININNHFEISTQNIKRELIPFIDSIWDTSFTNSKQIVENLFNKIDL